MIYFDTTVKYVSSIYLKTKCLNTHSKTNTLWHVYNFILTIGAYKKEYYDKKYP